MKEMIRGMMLSMLVYLALPDVGLTKPQTVLILVVGCGLFTALIWWFQDIADRRKQRKRKGDFRKFLNKTTL